jgi:hypothetical protein
MRIRIWTVPACQPAQKAWSNNKCIFKSRKGEWTMTDSLTDQRRLTSEWTQPINTMQSKKELKTYECNFKPMRYGKSWAMWMTGNISTYHKDRKK